jgi:hypothetical protein
MHRALFSSWKIALLWVIGISASVAAFFADGGGHEQLEANAAQIREKRGNALRKETGGPPPVGQPAPAATSDEEAEPEEPPFGEPMVDEVEGEPQAAPKPAPQPSAEGEESF